MFRGMHSDRLYSKEDAAPATAPGLSVTSLQHDHQENSWIGVLSVVSRPALSFLQKYLPGKSRTPTTRSGVSGWEDGDIKRSFTGENVFLDQLDDFMPPAEHHLTYHLHYQHETTNFGASSTEAIRWLSADSLRELGIHNNTKITSPVGYLATARNFLSQVLVNTVSTQDVRSTEHGRMLGRESWQSDSVASRVKSNWWWGGIWGSDENSHGWLSNLSWRACSGSSEPHCRENDSGGHCQQAESGTVASVSKPTELFEQRDHEVSKHSEIAGPSCHKGQLDNSNSQTASLEMLQSTEKPLLVCQIFSEHLVRARVATTCSEVAVLTPDQDNGYSSLEEEHSNSRMHIVEPPCPEPRCSEAGESAEELAFPTEGGASGETGVELSDDETFLIGREEEKASDNSDLSDSEEEEEERQPELRPLPHLQTPGCQNKAIAYIMGSPCSEDSESEPGEDGDWDGEDDDGFDSEGMSDFSDSEDLDSDEEEEEEDEGEENESDAEEANAEVEQLWNSFCQSRDPYNPRNFTASLQTAPKPSALPCMAQGGDDAPAEAPSTLSPLSSPSSSPRPLEEESWEEASEVDEAESLRLWNSFSCVADPYSPFNFQATLRTRETTRGRSRRPSPLSRHPTQDAEERLDSGFSEVIATLDQTCYTKLKKVRFVEEVEEFYASSDEDRRGPWEEFARDRCRFLRRVQETEDAIGYCLSPTFRVVIFERLYQSC